VKLSHNQLILILSELIFINLLVIFNIVSKPGTPDNSLYHQNKIISVNPQSGFGEILARTYPQPEPVVLSAQFPPTPIPVPVLTTPKKEYVIALMGDSMIETMGDNLDYLQVALKEKYPYTKFTMYNYGIGAEKVSEGLSRFNNSFDRGFRHYPPIKDLKPDILIVGSYSYNPFDQHDALRHRSNLAELVHRARYVTKVYLLAEIAPLENGFGKGPGGVNWPEELTKIHVQRIQEQMQNVFTIKTQLTVPIIDAYNSSKKPGSAFGRGEYVNPHDNVHPSILGQIFTANKIAETIELQ
jgi:hypothetical protein